MWLFNKGKKISKKKKGIKDKMKKGRKKNDKKKGRKKLGGAWIAASIDESSCELILIN
jgi:hypothetical protein